MKLEKNIPSTPAKILTSVCLWACVSLIFPIIAYFYKSLEPEKNPTLNHDEFLKIVNYFDSRLFWGIVLGGGLLLLVTKLVQLVLDKNSINPDRDMMSYVVDELFSQLVAIGSIITVANIMILFFNYKKSTSPSINLLTDFGWLGLVLWAIAIILMWLKPAKKHPTTADDQQDDTTKNKHV
ncbi:MAG: hypothetical protein RSE08_00610 [Lactococcus sp.]|uniref:hypothetical protein n=1 Tax=unclassified Janthinobacterium TaxID=2610881 RepID=UPI003AA51069